MLKHLMLTTALGGLMIGAAMAEGTPPSSPPASQTQTQTQTPPSATPGQPVPGGRSDSAGSTASSQTGPSGSTAASNTGASNAKFVNSQRADQFLASKFKGTDVIGADDEKIGDVSDILFDKDGKIEAYVIGVGGFLGIGAKDVALAPNSFQVVAGDKSKNEADKLKITMTKDELKQAANFEPYKAPSATTGMGGATGTRPAPSTAR
jgi:sporulation protein YlmC with PRC-barrel domain